jgi:uncharacterized protein RhaS with RHS repeats
LGVVVLKYTYDADSRLLSRWSIAKGTTYYTNDVVGNLTHITYPASGSVSLTYDPMNRLSTMVDGVGTTTYGYTLRRGQTVERLHLISVGAAFSTV